MDGSSGTALLLWDNRYRTDKNSSVKLSKIIVLKTDLINRMVVEINTLIIKAEKLNTVVIEIDKTTKITVIEIIKIIRLEVKNTIRKISGGVLALFRNSSISAPRKCFAFPRSRAFNKCPQARKNSHLRASTQWLFITRFHALISLLTRRLLDDSSNTLGAGFSCIFSYIFNVFSRENRPF